MPHVNELHEQHDQILVVSFASGDLAPDDRDRATAQSLVESCTQCAALHDDIVAIARATRALPPAVRTRDFRLTTDQAAKLRPAGWRRLVAGLSAPGSIFSRQLGLGLATLGIAGLLFSAAPAIQLGMGSSGAAPAAAPANGQSAPGGGAFAPEYPAGSALELHAGPAGSAAASAPAALEPVPAALASQAPAAAAGGDTSAASENPGYDTMASDSRNAITLDHAGKSTLIPAPAPQGEAAGGAANDGGGAATTSVPTSESGGPSGLVIVSSILLGAGVLVLLLRSISRRVAAR
jgi:hypothetical protein